MNEKELYNSPKPFINPASDKKAAAPFQNALNN
jgi:hypothetical protein